jgi:hypothetical protein
MKIQIILISCFVQITVLNIEAMHDNEQWSILLKFVFAACVYKSRPVPLSLLLLACLHIQRVYM